MSDVKVMNVKTGTVLIEDICVDVPQGVVVSIPAEKALRSKDLWRKISQKLIFRFHGGPIHAPSPISPQVPPEQVVASPVTHNPALVLALEEQNRLLREDVAARDEMFAAALLAQQTRFDELLTLVRGLSLTSGTDVRTERFEIGLRDAPLFIPTTIKPTDVQEHVNVQKSEGDGVSAAGAALRKLRERT